MRRLRAHYARRSGRRQLAWSFVVTFGVLWLVVEPLGLFFPSDFDWGWGGYIALVALSALAAAVQARPRKVVAQALPPTDVRVEIRVGDVLGQSGNIVVGTTDSFDTQLEDGVISRASVQGQLLTEVFAGDREKLDRRIDASLPNTGQPDPTKMFGKRVRYPIGTVAVVEHGDARYFLPAFTRMSSEPPAHVTSSITDLQVALTRTWEAINAAGQREPVQMPIVGSHLGRLGLSRTLLVQIIVLSFIAGTRHGGPPSLTIYVNPTDEALVDMAVLSEWLRGLCAV